MIFVLPRDIIDALPTLVVSLNVTSRDRVPGRRETWRGVRARVNRLDLRSTVHSDDYDLILDFLSGRVSDASAIWMREARLHPKFMSMILCVCALRGHDGGRSLTRGNERLRRSLSANSNITVPVMTRIVREHIRGDSTSSYDARGVAVFATTWRGRPEARMFGDKQP